MRLGEDDELGTFIFRTTGFNSIRTLLTRMRYFQAVSGGLLANLSLELRLRGKSTTQSHRAAVFYVDLTLRSGTTLVEAIKGAKEDATTRAAAGVIQADLDEAARRGFAMGAFEDSEEDGAAIAEEFYPEGNLVNVDAPDLDRLSSRKSARLVRKLNGLSSQMSSSEDSL